MLKNLKKGDLLKVFPDSQGDVRYRVNYLNYSLIKCINGLNTVVIISNKKYKERKEVFLKIFNIKNGQILFIDQDWLNCPHHKEAKILKKCLGK